MNNYVQRYNEQEIEKCDVVTGSRNIATYTKYS